MASDNRYPETTRPSLEEATGLALFGLTSIRAGLNDEWARPERIMEVFPDFNSRNAQEYRVYLGLNALRDESRNLMLTLHTAIERRRLKRSVDPSSHIMTLDPESDLLLFSDHESTLRTKRPHITITSHEEGPEWWGRITTPTRDLRQYVIEYGVTRRAIAPGIAASWLLLTSQRNVPGIPAPLRRAIHERTSYKLWSATRALPTDYPFADTLVTMPDLVRA